MRSFLYDVLQLHVALALRRFNSLFICYVLFCIVYFSSSSREA